MLEKITSDLVNVLAANGITISTFGSVNALSGTSWLVLGDVQGLLAPVTIHGSGHDTLNLDDSGDLNAQTILVHVHRNHCGLGTAGIPYSGITTMNVVLGTGGNTDQCEYADWRHDP